jgi:hypothetical protein
LDWNKTVQGRSPYGPVAIGLAVYCVHTSLNNMLNNAFNEKLYLCAKTRK